MVKKHNNSLLKGMLNITLVVLLWVAGVASLLKPQPLPEERYTLRAPYNRTGLAINTIKGSDAEPPLTPPPSVQAKGWVLLDAASGRMILSNDPEEKLPMASTTKIMTALITLEQPNLDEYFTVDGAAITVEGSSMGLQIGDKATLRTLAAGMLLPSANDGARAAAVRIAGSEAAFAQMMNEYAQKIGMKNTSFTTASGLDQGEHYSTAYDMALLARHALQNDEFVKLCSSHYLNVDYGNPPYMRTLHNHNKLIGSYEEAIGVKTGFTKKAGRCLVSAAEREGLTLVMVTLNAADDFNTHRAMYEWAFDSLHFLKVNDRVENASVAVTGGVKPRLSIQIPWEFGAYLTAEEAAHIAISINIPPFVYAPIQKGEPIGEVVMRLGENRLAVAPVVAAETIAAPVKEKSWQGWFRQSK